MLDQPFPHAKVSHPRGWVGAPKACVDVGQGGHPIGTELVEEHRSVQTRNPLANVVAVGLVGHTRAGPERLDDVRTQPGHAGEELRQGGEVVETALLRCLIAGAGRGKAAGTG